jgi:hypothetical protein
MLSPFLSVFVTVGKLKTPQWVTVGQKLSATYAIKNLSKLRDLKLGSGQSQQANRSLILELQAPAFRPG